MPYTSVHDRTHPYFAAPHYPVATSGVDGSFRQSHGAQWDQYAQDETSPWAAIMGPPAVVPTAEDQPAASAVAHVPPPPPPVLDALEEPNPALPPGMDWSDIEPQSELDAILEECGVPPDPEDAGPSTSSPKPEGMLWTTVVAKRRIPKPKKGRSSILSAGPPRLKGDLSPGFTLLDIGVGETPPPNE